MKVTVEISMYPLREDYVLHVDNFIKALYKYNVSITSNYTSTHVIGEFSEVMTAINSEMEIAFKNGKASFVLKVLSGDLNQEIDLSELR